MRPPFSYYGGKVGLAERIIALMPAHRVYIEPFFGSGAVLFAKAPARIEIANDIDLNVWTFYKVLRERPEELEQACRLTPYHREELAAALLDEPLDELERARRFWCRINMSFGKQTGQQTGFSVTTARTQSVAATTQARIARFAAAAERMASVVWENGDAADLVDRLATPDAVVYADPPYLSSARRRGSRRLSKDYLHDMGDEAGHRRLAEVLRATSATVLLSGYHDSLYDQLYADWPRLEFPVRVHSSNARTVERGERVEVLWSNRQLQRSDDQLSFG